MSENICIDMCEDIYTDMCENICIDMCDDIYIDMCEDICIDMCEGSPVLYRHVQTYS